MLKTSNPYGANDTYKSSSAIVDAERAKASGKPGFQARCTPLGTTTKVGGSQAMSSKTPPLNGK